MLRVGSIIANWLRQPVVPKLVVNVPQPLPVATTPAAALPKEKRVMNLASILALIQALPSLLGVVNAVVHDTEQVIGGMPGGQKLAAATAKVNTIVGAAVQDAQTLSAVSQVVPTLVNASVAAFNAGGMFKHAPGSDAAQAAPAAAQGAAQ